MYVHVHELGGINNIRCYFFLLLLLAREQHLLHPKKRNLSHISG